MEMLFPKRLTPGDKIGIISTSSPAEPEWVERTREYFETHGYPVEVGPHTLDRLGFMAGTTEDRAQDIHAMLHDPSIRMLMTASGGATAARLLPLLDYAAMRADPKIFIGLSDPTILLNGFTHLSGVVTFHGPNGYDFGKLGIAKYSEENFWPIVSGNIEIPYKFPTPEMCVLKDGPVVEGRLLGGNFPTNIALLGTPWEPDWEGKILFLEELFVDLQKTDAMLTHLRLAGVFDKIYGLVMGQYVQLVSQGLQETYESVILDNCTGYHFPVVSNLLIGHTLDQLTLPVGCRTRLDTSRRALELVEWPVR